MVLLEGLDSYKLDPFLEGAHILVDPALNRCVLTLLSPLHLIEPLELSQDATCFLTTLDGNAL